ncbi:MobT family relaxase [Tetragenococcus koreensis]|uniref:Cro/Cl family transcriptional regulator n=1 Tax=Tetragenococcus koreensis TaxID=290335 RepID=A0AAN4UC32_9ENTE|nr:MobT family relaxase [Tetragenococcus koreensis]GEQ49665.1 Cro/Cl family transcriptional regulator [Tetragenococcus koreensis]GEQ52111.1 Cro/Cl family transcriptional regulator [Tetragenococcus koreensis]GEQ54646.1 Cro/Cl family transcriptional regulator [Tetragenococcus koreensis]GEQ57074.1 Cro/Cl family transcriptional regulator [Tetragenococcus koreensis]GEQ59678.1 Cro/Cl family transcriptional regulator [Tetragenococcus koreensis]
MTELAQKIQRLKNKRLDYGVSQNKLAVELGISRQYISEIETEKVLPSESLLHDMEIVLERLNPEQSLEMLFDYVRIRFPTTEPQSVIENILKLKKKVMLHEDRAFYSYDEQYVFGEIVVMVSHELEKGVLVEMKGKGCRQFEHLLLAQHRSWYDFFLDVFSADGVYKRLDIAINDKIGLLDIPELAQKCRNEECISVFRNFKNYRSGELVRQHEKADMGNTLYIGSLKSDVYFCLYEKDYEQYVRLGIPLEENPVKNRFEIRLKNERALHAVIDLLNHRNVGETSFSIINRYIRFVDKDSNQRRSQWRINENWAYFLGENQRSIRLTSQPEPYTFDRTLNWLARQVMPTLKLAMEVDRLNQTTMISDMLDYAQLSDRHRKILAQQTLPVSEVITP